MGYHKRILTRESIIQTYIRNRNIDDVIRLATQPASVQLNNDTFVEDVYDCITNNETGNLKVLLENYIYNK